MPRTLVSYSKCFPFVLKRCSASIRQLMACTLSLAMHQSDTLSVGSAKPTSCEHTKC